MSLPSTASMMANRLKAIIGLQEEAPALPLPSRIPSLTKVQARPSLPSDAAKKPLKDLTGGFGYSFDNSLQVEIQAQRAKEEERMRKEAAERAIISEANSLKREEGINEIVKKIDQKLNSAKAKLKPTLYAAKPSSFLDPVVEATPSTAKRTQRSATTDKSPDAEVSTPGAYQGTDEQGNRLSILPQTERPKSITRPKSEQKTKSVQELLAEPAQSAFVERKNFVKMNMNQPYKPKLRGAAFTNKMMAKKSTSNKFKARLQHKLKIEQMQSRDQVNAFGGLGKVGLDYEHNEGGPKNYEVPAFSPALAHLAPQPKPDLYQSDEEMLVADFEDIDEQLKQIEPTIDDKSDAAAYSIPSSDAGYLAVLKERFGHDSFKEGQLEAIKIILEEKRNALVVLATGGGKSLIYQFTTLFSSGLVLIVTPLIALMTDQLNKLPDFLPGASINSQQNFGLKKSIVQAVCERKIKILFITPERLFMEDLSKFGREISMVCVDEIHCASEWSHNFRPTYLMLHEMIKEKLGPQTRVLGLTATATKSTQHQICRIFDISYPRHLVTQPDLSRLNLQLSITRDTDKTRALLTLLKSDSYKGLTSILLFATQRRTTELVSGYLSQQGISSAAYHAGKSDEQRSFIQKQFCTNKIRVLCCTIAFSMGIDKSDIQSVIHYDLPRSIENYVQEIGRAGRDGTLARCHMFLNNDDFYQLRRITLSDLLDSQSCFRLTSRVLAETKRQFLKTVEPEFQAKKPRRKNNDDQNFDNVVDVFEHEAEIQEYYQGDRIELAAVEGLQGPLYVAIDAKELMTSLDLKKEIVMTMLNQLEKTEGSFFRVDSVLPASIGIRFHKESLETLAKSSPLFAAIFSLAQKPHMGVYRVQTVKLAKALGCKPYNVPRFLYQTQMQGDAGISYETDHESFILQVHNIPKEQLAMPLSEAMHVATREIESALVQKLNCMYFVARKVSVPTIEALLKREKAETAQMYIDFSHDLNDLINKYFRTENEATMEIEIAGSLEERNCLMPLLYIDSSREKAELEAQVKQILRDFHHGANETQWLDPANRLKPLDVTKILMGIQSSRESVKRFQNESIWAKRQEYDYDDILQGCTAVVQQFYLEMLPLHLKKTLH